MSHNSNYINNIKNSITKYTFKVILLDSDENEIREIQSDILDGSVNVNLQNGSRRSGSISLANTDASYDFSPDEGKIWADNKFKVQTGIVVNNNEILFDQGIFVIGEPNMSNDSNANSIANYELYDKFAYLDGTLSGEIVNTFIIPLNTNIISAVTTIFQTASNDGIQIAYNRKPLLAEASSVVTPYAIIAERGKTYFDIIEELANAINHTFYFDNQGYPRFEPNTNPEFEAPMLTLEENDILKSSINRRYELRNLRNNIRVEGVTWDTGVTHDAISTITDGSTSTSRIGTRSMFIEDNVIYNDSLAQQRADYEVNQRSTITDTVNISFYPTDNLDVGRNVQVTDSRINLTDALLQIRQITIPLKKDTQASMDTQRTISM